jgi:hypothetical protein
MENESNMDLEQYESDNRQIIQQLIDAEDGPCKNASAASQDMIRLRIRENGFSRKILPPKQISNADLNRLPTTELPVIVEDMETDQPGAKSISFNDTPDTQFYRGAKFIVIFNKITSPEWTKNVDELRTYKMDLRQVVTDNSLKDIQTEEDLTFVNTVDEIVGSPTGVGASGLQQNFTINGAITRTSYIPTLSYLENRYLNNGVFLVNRKTAKSFLTFDRNEWGGDRSQELWEKGLEALPEGQVLGVRHLFTIKQEIVPNGYVYQFAEPGFLGRFYILEDVTMYVDKKVDILRFRAQEKIGVTFANVSSVNLVTFTAVT